MTPAADKSLTNCLAGEIDRFVRSFTETDVGAKQSILQLYNGDADVFCDAAIHVLADSELTAGSRYVVHLLLKDRSLVKALVDAQRSRREEAIAVVRSVGPLGTALATDLERALAALVRAGAGPDMDARLLRTMDLLEAASAERRCLLFQRELLNHENSSVRAKAALLIARSSRTAALAGRLLLDRDVRVQASAVEALWSFDPAEANPMLIAASSSRTPRVAANAAVGLYRNGELNSIKLLLHLARHQDPAFRDSGIWAMGETGDSRFLPFLNDLCRDGAAGRVAVLGAISRIRARQKQASAAGAYRFRIHSVHAGGDGTRKVVFGVWGDGLDVESIRPIDFSVSEEGATVGDYGLTAEANPAVLMTGWILPRITSISDPYAIAIGHAMSECAAYKRPDDLWRIDRYSIDGRLPPSERSKNGMPYDEDVAGPQVKALRGFFTGAEPIGRVLATPGTKQQAANDLPNALDRVVEAMTHLSGTRHLFVFLSSGATENGLHPKWAASFAESLESDRIRLHLIVPDEFSGADIEKVLRGSTASEVTQVPLSRVADAVTGIYSRLLNTFELTYRMQAVGTKATITLQTSGGRGEAEFVIGESRRDP